MSVPQISIITINYNDGDGLERTMDSIRAQSSRNFEWIIVDKCSEDRTPELLEQIGDLELNCRIIVEEDDGIFEAMNKGIRFATGTYCLFLNSGDHLCDEQVLMNIAPSLDSEILVGALKEIHPDRPERNRVKCFTKRTLTRSYFYNRTLPHQATFIQRTLFETFGGYDETFRIKGDHDFFSRVCLKKGVRVKTSPICVSVYYVDGLSSQMRYSELYRKEMERMRKKNFSIPYNSFRKAAASIRALSQ